jgi:hypothetical protein
MKEFQFFYKKMNIDESTAIYDLKTKMIIGNAKRLSAAAVRFTINSYGSIDLYSHATELRSLKYTEHSILIKEDAFLDNEYIAYEALYDNDQRVCMLKLKK